MKIAAITEDGITISQHFGRAPYYLVLTINDGKILARERRNKLGHAQFTGEPHKPGIPGQPHGMGAGAHDRHMRMSEVISDCEALLCGGMGQGAYLSMTQRGIKPVVTDIRDIDQAAMAYFEGNIIDQVDRLH